MQLQDPSSSRRRTGDPGAAPALCDPCRSAGLRRCLQVSEHIIELPRKQFPRSPLFYDPVVTLSWVAAVTERVRLGTTMLVLPMRHPLPLAEGIIDVAQPV